MLVHSEKTNGSVSKVNFSERNNNDISHPKKINAFDPVEAKLTINAPHDIYEKEADDMADKVIRTSMPEPINFSSAENSVHRKCGSCEEEEQQTRRKETSSDSIPAVPSIVQDVLGSNGKQLDADTRAYMEPHFNHDFGSVKIHDNDLAAKSASSINALAYTSGNNVVFNSGQYNTSSDSGKRLLAHELTHVVQQTKDIKRIQKKPSSVTLNHSSACRDPKKIAEAIPGALAMINTAVLWFISLGESDVKRINFLLKQIFLSDSDKVKIEVENRIFSIKHYLENAKDGNLFFDCPPGTDPDCGSFNAFVRQTEAGIIHICQPFFNLSLEERKWTLIHECAHLTGAVIDAEPYYANFGTVDCVGSVSASTSEALRTADNYSKFIWCLTRPSGTMLNNP